MAEQFTKPGTANVSASDRFKLRFLLKHYCPMEHTFTVCVRDQVKHGVSPAHAKRRCAVIKMLCGKQVGGKKKKHLVAA